MIDGVDMSALTVPVFAAVFGMGWAACYSIVVIPMKDRLKGLEDRMKAVENAKDERIASLEAKLIKHIGLSSS